MTTVGIILLFLPVSLLVYALAVYPASLWIWARLRPATVPPTSTTTWPHITLTVPAFNEEAAIGETIRELLLLDYPAERRSILVISDASTDRTDEIVREFAAAGVELLRLAARGGKTAAENAAGGRATGDIVVNVDASVRVLPASLKPLVRAFDDPSVGVASGRDVSVNASEGDRNSGEAGYVGYEMWLRGLETRIHSIVGASGCFYATRRILYHDQFPVDLSRDFASALIARERGYRSVSVADAVCLVPRGTSIRGEFRRKTRTMARGLATLQHMRHLMDVDRYGVFAWMLVSHKLCRWLFYAGLPFAAAGLLLLAFEYSAARVLLAGVATLGAVGLVGTFWPDGYRMPRVVAMPAFALVSNAAGVVAWWRYLLGQRDAKWEPTRRTS